MYSLIQKADKDSNPDEVAVKRTKELALLQIEEISRQPIENQKVAKRTECGMKENKKSNIHSVCRSLQVCINNCTFMNQFNFITSFEIPTTP